MGFVLPESITEVEHEEIRIFCENEKHPANKTIERIQRRVVATIINDLKQAGFVLPTLADGTPVILCIPAAGVNAPHRRDRIWIVAFNSSNSSILRLPESRHAWKWGTGLKNNYFDDELTNSQSGNDREHIRESVERQEQQSGKPIEQNTDTNTSHKRLQRSKKHGSIEEIRQERNEHLARLLPSDWQDFPTQSPVCTGDDGISERLADITFPKWRTESIKALGNAVVPQIPIRIFETINQIMK